MNRRPAGAAALLLVIPLLAASCSARHYSQSADREAGEILDEFFRRGLEDRPANIQMPSVELPAAEAAAPTEPGSEPTPAATPDAMPPDATPPDEAPTDETPVETSADNTEPLRIDLKTALSIAVHQSRNFQSQRESLYLSGLSFSLTKFGYGPQFSSAVSYLWGDGDHSPAASSVGASLGVSQLLPTNGSVSLNTGLSKVMNRGDSGLPDDWSTSFGVNFSQPLLRGAGYSVYREGMTQAERGLVYSVRDFELFREQFTIDTTQQFFRLLAQKKQLSNVEESLHNAEVDLEGAQALWNARRKSDQELALARRRRIEAESSVLNARDDLKRAVESFLISLGLDPKTPAELVDEEPPFESIHFEAESAVEVALHNRLDIQTRREVIEDQERRLRLQRLDFLPDLSVNAGYSSGGSGRNPGSATPDSWSRSAGLTLNIPIQQIGVRNAWRAAEISLLEAHRGWDLFLDSERSNIRQQLRNLKNTELQIELQGQSVIDEQRNVERFEIMAVRGNVSTRDLVEARRTLVQAQNSLIDQKVNHLIQRLSLYKDLGIMFVDDEGMWSVGPVQIEEGPR